MVRRDTGREEAGAKVSNGQSAQRVRGRRAFCLCCGVRAEAVGMA